MPPSGYTTDQSNAVVEFLRSCARALEDEGIQKGMDPYEALSAECRNIDTILQENNGDRFAANVLALTWDFYKSLLSRDPKSYEEFRNSVGVTLDTARQEILAVHVPAI